MKTLLIVWLAIAGSLVAESPARIGLGALPDQAGKPSVRALSTAEFLALRNASRNESETPQPLPPRKESYDLKSLSTFVQHEGSVMILPKGAVLWCPESILPRLVSSPVGNCIPWIEFATSNRNWISTFEVTIDQASGKQPIPETTIEQFKKGTSLVIATHQGNPITVIQNPAPEDSGKASAP